MGWFSKSKVALLFGAGNVTVPTRDALLTGLEFHLHTGQPFAVATVNLDHLVKLRRDPNFRDAYSRQSHVVADGNPIVWLNRLAGKSVELVPGSDLIDPLAAIAARNHVPIALIGATAETLDLAAEQLIARHAGLDIVAKLAPSIGFDPHGAESEACLAEIRSSGARLCFIALGAPKQEQFAVRGMQTLQNCGFVSIGAGLEFIAGTKRRAPFWVRRLAFEWLWRLSTDPRRLLGRYVSCAMLMPTLLASALQHRIVGRSNLETAHSTGKS
jgi:exopolysaccharide biosynthesis WecB/TagA/CpsF family protein